MNEGMDNLKEIEDLEKEIALVREDAQVEYLKLSQKNLTLLSSISDLKEKILLQEITNNSHQKLNGELRKEYDALKKANQNLRKKIEQYQDKTAHYRRKGVL